MSAIDLTNPRQLIALLQKHHSYTQKKFGQNFLINRSVITESITAAALQPSDIVVEIGVGTGVLTQELATKSKFVHAFEIDESLQPLLEETLAGISNIGLHFEDFKRADLASLIGNHPYKILANLPYNAGTHILGQLIQLSNPPQSITVLLQKEVAQKITASAPHATYLSNFVSLYGRPRIIKVVGPGNFFPAPKVDSAILHIDRHAQISTPPTATFSRFLHRGFANPRKKINKAFSQEGLRQAAIDPNLRPENLLIEQWVALYKIVTTSSDCD